MITFSAIKKSIVSAVYALLDGDKIQDLIVIENTRKDFEGDLTLVVFSLLKLSKKSPEKTAESIGNYLIENELYFEDFNVVKGFLNLKIKQKYWLIFFKYSKYSKVLFLFFLIIIKFSLNTL